MSPTKNNRCSFGKDKYTHNGKCHRFDQSSLNIITSSLLERDGWNRRGKLNDNSIRNFTETRRGEVQNSKLSIPCDHISTTNK
ncbi:hypothetical protein PRIPAC_94058 [Pristionchus pacificus]|uniref:Uncharacterized protein n=1 Tax=Pristionchus pacificus TaxID=54126 RepID=A0A2A6BPR0_PRIPA|nr:hypothetical protein PRIPAC_94058 [Pristionchus pacificus]|eukprot:PDM67885.1 hypothetical protein PRIPAC_45929 [Pristionchus pacificus]